MMIVESGPDDEPSTELPSLDVRGSVLSHPDMQELVKFREIKESDYHLLLALSTFPPVVFIDYHNYFSFAKENLTARLQEDIEQDVPHKEFAKIYLALSERYNYYVCNHINRVFERINRGE